jgi:signal transduction histidine kinase
LIVSTDLRSIVPFCPYVKRGKSSLLTDFNNMKKTTAILLCFFSIQLLSAQSERRTELQQVVKTASTDTAKLEAFWQLGDDFITDNLDSARLYITQGLSLAKKVKEPDWEAQFLFTMGKLFKQQGNYPQAIDYYLQAKTIWDKTGNMGGAANAELFIGEVYAYQDNCNLSLPYYKKAKAVYQEAGNSYGVAMSFLKTGICFEKMQRYDSALFYLQQIDTIRDRRADIETYLSGNILHIKGKIFAASGRIVEAMSLYRQSLPMLQRNVDLRTIGQVMLSIAALHQKQGRVDSGLYYARQSLLMAQKNGFNLEVMHASGFLAQVYKKQGHIDSAFAYLELSVANKDSLFSRERVMAVQNKLYEDESLRQRYLAQQQKLQNNVRVGALLATLLVFLVMAAILWRNNKREQKANALLMQQKQEIQLAMTELEAVQRQLIHAEKMASLGELTAGIAHEIQNPLNFINNFSDIGTELVEEVREEIKAGNYDEAKAILTNLAENLEKINQHGSRADAIVKNMLQHSRKNTGERELTDINSIVDDCLRLSYQALRNKDKTFNAVLETHFDPAIGKVSIIPQDMGRVFLNLFSNALYAVQEKARRTGNGYMPTVQVTTRKHDESVAISVWDNGTGIPEKVVDKIYQPFFTTKPSGEGTGLGLSMSYDIVTKVHGGKMTVNSKAGEYAEFVIEMPAS